MLRSSFPVLLRVTFAGLICLLTLQMFRAVDAQPFADEKIPAADGQTAGDESEERDPEYVRLQRTDDNLLLTLDTSIIHMGNSKKYPETTVDLIGAVHLGEAEYYETLNRRFQDYDVLLFEAVMPEEAVRKGWRPGRGNSNRNNANRANPNGVKSAPDAEVQRRLLPDEEEWSEAKIGLSAIGVLQIGMKEALGLEFQLTAIDYSAANFVHADMTQEELEATMRRRGESFSEMFLREMGKSVMKQQDQHPLAQNLDVLMSLLTNDRLFRVRRIAAVQLARADEGSAFAGPDGTSTIITERNIKALDVLKEKLKRGHKKIGIFYGAGHFDDMEKRMVDDLGFERTRLEWLTAWHLRNKDEREAASASSDGNPPSSDGESAPAQEETGN
ncbi:MAG: hypothetical protein KDA96_20820 [Planctomycetaceae bacterium]|nr:hypothetical protein [Planctomycetaceae bacterium]